MVSVSSSAPRFDGRHAAVAITPERCVLVLGLVVGLLYLVVTPPFQAPDEPSHFARAYHISEGRLLAVRGSRYAGGDLPAVIPSLYAIFVERVPGHPDRKISRGDYRAAFRIPMERNIRTFVGYPAAAAYTPIPYIPQALGVAVGRVANARPLVIFYLSRLSNLLICTALVYGAVKVTPFFKWVFACLAMTPMATFLRSSASGDALNDAAALLLIALVLALAFTAAGGNRAMLVSLVVAAALVATSKPVYGFLPLLVFLIPRSNLNTPTRYWALVSAVVAMTGVALLVSSWIATTRYVPLRADVRAADHLALIAGHPIRFLGVASRTLGEEFPLYLSHFVGTLGWLDTPLPGPAVYGYAVLLVVLALLDGSATARMSSSQRGLLALVSLSVIGSVAASQFVTWTPIGSPVIEGIQGRYFIPVGPLLLLLLFNRRLHVDITRRRIGWVVFAALSVTSAVAAKVLVSRYYL
jgi:uncharacterized membrane protein